LNDAVPLPLCSQQRFFANTDALARTLEKSTLYFRQAAKKRLFWLTERAQTHRRLIIAELREKCQQYSGVPAFFGFRSRRLGGAGNAL